jgi:hypothetical protein
VQIALRDYAIVRSLDFMLLGNFLVMEAIEEF